MKNSICLLAAMTLAAGTPAAYADAISPGIRERGKIYSKEAPDTSYYGTGIGGRAMEASVLRMEAERFLQDAEFDQALRRVKKAVQLDPTDTEGHLLLAKVLTRKLEATDGPIDEKLLRDAMYEWRMLWLHDADALEQQEAKYNTLRLLRIAHGLAKQKKIEEKARAKAKQALAMQRARESKDNEKAASAPAAVPAAAAPAASAPAVVPAASAPSAVPAANAAPAAGTRQIANKKKHFFLF